MSSLTKAVRTDLAMRFYELSAMANDEGTRYSTIKWAVEAADALLAEIDRTAPKAKSEFERSPNGLYAKAITRAESAEGCLAEEYDKRKAAEAKLAFYEVQNRGSIDQWEALERRAEAAEDRVKELDESVAHWKASSKMHCEAANTHYGEKVVLHFQFTEAKAEMERLKSGQMEHDTAITFPLHDIINELQDRLAAIDAAKAGEPPCPVVAGVPYPSSCADAIFSLAAWGRKGWDAAAALRSVDTDSIRQATLTERERIAEAMAQWIDYRAADGDAVRILAYLTPKEVAHD